MLVAARSTLALAAGQGHLEVGRRRVVFGRRLDGLFYSLHQPAFFFRDNLHRLEQFRILLQFWILAQQFAAFLIGFHRVAGIGSGSDRDDRFIKTFGSVDVPLGQ